MRVKEVMEFAADACICSYLLITFTHIELRGMFKAFPWDSALPDGTALSPGYQPLGTMFPSS